MTNKENSIKLHELGFEGDSEDFIVLDVPDISKRIMFPKVPAYDAEVLFKWLREKRYDIWFYCDMYVCMKFSIGRMEDEEIEFSDNESLADMLAEAIIWIMENES